MRVLAVNKISDEFLRTMFLERLPTHVRTGTVLVTSQDSLDTIASMADKIMEIESPPYAFMCSSNGQPTLSTKNEDIAKLQQQVLELTNSIQELRVRSRSRSSSRNRGRQYDVCWYHYKFQNQARKCVPPCKFTTQRGNEQAHH